MSGLPDRPSISEQLRRCAVPPARRTPLAHDCSSVSCVYSNVTVAPFFPRAPLPRQTKGATRSNSQLLESLVQLCGQAEGRNVPVLGVEFFAGMTRSLAVAISFLLASIALWSQSEPAKPNPDTSSSAPSSSSPPSSAPSSSSALPDSTKIELVKGERAIYPVAAEEKKLQGQVWVRLHISETGDIEGVDVISGDPILAAAAVSAIKKWKFKPYIKNGHPVKVLYKMPMDFAFRENVKDTPIPVENNSISSVDKNPADASSRPATDPPNGNNVAGTKQVRISQGVSKGLLLHKVQPIYPYEAMRNHVEGTVLLRAVIDKNGRISSLEPISGPKELTTAAIGAVEQWRYRPYLLQGEPVEVETQITVNFQLR